MISSPGLHRQVHEYCEVHGMKELEKEFRKVSDYSSTATHGSKMHLN